MLQLSRRPRPVYDEPPADPPPDAPPSAAPAWSPPRWAVVPLWACAVVAAVLLTIALARALLW